MRIQLLLLLLVHFDRGNAPIVLQMFHDEPRRSESYGTYMGVGGGGGTASAGLACRPRSPPGLWEPHK